ncbi:Nitrilase/cyanide hydratase and apolipoprotein N- acyltransferase [Rhodopirellula maiorica SM1]|uniref:Nitrilase/cyanide hydratase and apolipoprotein N-acyltransferase n=1 Tax=Rhodopirellula maiorica SM1 TaxID=1265738 RepID=M5RTM6_9BACT|nr:carbon-nitrogen hydrolase family protein [Rhodopirellula maiorica]EMI22561.1 Nitrilase/cyanide hydratase and apolipoprotein N- acyltransferase [Rhodopirellula maiorica SM1]
MLIACVQSDVTFANIAENRKRIVEHVHEAGKRQAKLVVMPECMLCGYAYESREAAWQHAVAIDDAVFIDLANLAATYDLHLSVGFLEKSGDQLFNAAALVGPSGVVGCYRKVHLPALGVDRFVDRGDIPYQPLQARDARVGLAICYDSSFPEPMRVLALGGADIIALGTNWPVTAYRTAEIVPPARSMENHLFFVAANRVGSEGGFKFCGLSSICGPDGVILAQSKADQPEILYADVNLAEARNKRIERTPGAHVIDRFEDRRPDFYEAVAAAKPASVTGKSANGGATTPPV